MIGKLKGRVDSVFDDSLILDVNGVGYHVFADRRTLGRAMPDDALALLIETHVREDHIHLFGFPDAASRDWFRLLFSVQGVGPKMALAILGLFSPAQLAMSIGAQDKKALTAVSGVGPKLAERIVTELKNKVAAMPTGASMSEIVTTGDTKKSKKAVAEIPTIGSEVEDAVSALVNLGYGRTDAYGVVMRLRQSGEARLDQLITSALKELAA